MSVLDECERKRVITQALSQAIRQSIARLGTAEPSSPALQSSSRPLHLVLCCTEIRSASQHGTSERARRMAGHTTASSTLSPGSATSKAWQSKATWFRWSLPLTNSPLCPQSLLPLCAAHATLAGRSPLSGTLPTALTPDVPAESDCGACADPCPPERADWPATADRRAALASVGDGRRGGYPRPLRHRRPCRAPHPHARRAQTRGASARCLGPAARPSACCARSQRGRPPRAGQPRRRFCAGGVLSLLRRRARCAPSRASAHSTPCAPLACAGEARAL